MRHIRACQNARLPGERLRLFAGGSPVGWVSQETALDLGALEATVTPHGVAVADASALSDAARQIMALRGFRLRGEAFDVRDDETGTVIGTIDRGALPLFGVRADGVHLNGLVRRPDGLHLWVGRRAAHKSLDPGKLDHLVAGGVPAGLTPERTLAKEAEEEAALPADLIAHAREVGVIRYAMERREGLRRDRLFCYDLELPHMFVPRPADGEVESFELWPLPRVLQTVRETDDFKFNVNLVLIDLFLRHGLVAGEEAVRLRAALDEK
jgi:8-oxo-dGTP pyrophosphatase MutT (NUDIX family)